MSNNGSTHYGQVQVHFITNSPDIELPEGKRQLLVPTSEAIQARIGYGFN
jgi:ribosome biogenesis protein YTM1